MGPDAAPAPSGRKQGAGACPAGLFSALASSGRDWVAYCSGLYAERAGRGFAAGCRLVPASQRDAADPARQGLEGCVYLSGATWRGEADSSGGQVVGF